MSLRTYVLWITILIITISICSPTFGQRVDYTGHQVVRVDLQNQAELDLLLSISPDIWSDYIGVGPLDARIPPDRLEDLQNSGLSYTVLIKDLGLHTIAHLNRTPRRSDWLTSRDPNDLWSDYMDPNEMLAWMNQQVLDYPGLCELIDIGDSVEGRDIWVMHVSGTDADPNKPALFYHALIHCREWITAPVVMYLANHLLTNYGGDACITDLVNRTDFYLAPCANPDGYVHTWDVERLWRKNRRDNGGGCWGVDLNRNWGYQWGYDDYGSSPYPCDTTYRGPSAFSEPETTALSNFIINHPNIKAYMDYHNYSQLILWPYGYDYVLPPEPDNSTFDMLGNQMQQLIQDVHGEYYEAGPIASTIYTANGSSVDWVYGNQGRFAFTIELRPESDPPGFELPASEILPTCEENLPAIMYLSEWATAVLTLSFPTGLPSYLSPNDPTTIKVVITDAQESYASGTGLIHYRFNPAASFDTDTLTHLTGNEYQATIPAGPCGATCEYYFTAQGDGGGSASSPCAPPANTYTAPVQLISVIFTDDFETDKGWTVSGVVSEGDWERGVPVNNDRGDPPADYDGSGQCYLTENDPLDENSDVDSGTTILTSPLLDISSGGTISYAYWLNDVPTGPAGFRGSHDRRGRYRSKQHQLGRAAQLWLGGVSLATG